MAKTYLEYFVDSIPYESLDQWKVPKISHFSYTKSLYAYQERAMQNIARVLRVKYGANSDKALIYDSCLSMGMDDKSFRVKEYDRPIDKRRGIISNRFTEMSQYYPVENEEGKDGFISASNFFNRAAFWMATGSGKSLVLIKTIEYIDYLMTSNLIPKNDILVLLPREDLIKKFKSDIEEYNLLKEKHISLISLKNYERVKKTITLGNDIRVFYYRSDLIRDTRSENIVDFKDYQNDGKWYVFLDEAHRGETGTSSIQDYISIMTRNGFLFNYSATFTDEIDYATTVFNFNLEKFIRAGYGKTITISNSSFHFGKDNDDFTESEKQEQVLLALLNLALIKKSRRDKNYHSPMMLTLVNTVNTDSSDLLMFFKELEKIAIGELSQDLFDQTKEKLKRNLLSGSMVFTEGEVVFDESLLDSLTVADLLGLVFNSKTNGRIELLEGEKGKEIALKLETSTSPFALIKIGDADKFKREQIGDNYVTSTSYYDKKYFESLNDSDNINILIGSRSFYEGWDSNRPNVISYINIGGKDAQKYVLQSIGRGVRIEPKHNNRKRLPENSPEKNHLLETLFIYPTDKKGLEQILETLDGQKNPSTEYEKLISLDENKEMFFDLLIPKFKKNYIRQDLGYFNLAKNQISQLRNYFNAFNKEILMLLKGLSGDEYDYLKSKIFSSNFFQEDEYFNYSNMDILLDRVIKFVTLKAYDLDRLEELSDEIVHFKNIRVAYLTEEEKEELKDKIVAVKGYKEFDSVELATKLVNGEISKEEFEAAMHSKSNESFKDLRIYKLANHYYIPLIYSTVDKVDYIKSIIDVDSEVDFIENLIQHIEKNDVQEGWMFSKIEESVDDFYIPYYSSAGNEYKRFYPDFVFWVKADNTYKIVLVDPKGTSYTDYISKVDGFEELFYKDGKPVVFKYKDKYDVSFDLKMITKDLNRTIPAKYKEYWLNSHDFSFLYM